MTMGRTQIHPDENKLAELVLYISARTASDPNFGAVKMEKTLFYSDFLAYATLGKPVTGTAYRRFERGPVSRSLPTVKRRLIQKREAAEVICDIAPGYQSKKLAAARQANLSAFSPDEVSLVDQVLAAVSSVGSKQVSALSHLECGWRAAAENDDIPYESVFVSCEKPTSADADWVRRTCLK